MKKLKILNILFAVGLMFIGFGCTDGFDSMNTSSTSLNKSNLTAELLFVTSVNKGVAGDYQRNYSLYDDMYAHYFSNGYKNFASGNNATGSYEYNDGWASVGWRDFYASREKEYNDINGICGSQANYTNMKAMNNIWNCFLWLRITDRFGDVPYKGVSTTTAVPYSSQKSVYLSLLARLDSACTAIGSSSVEQYNPGSYDLLYDGNASEWKKFGYSLMLRMAMRISNVDAADAKTYAAKAVAGGVFTANSDNAKVKEDFTGIQSYDYYDNLIINWKNVTTDMDFLNYMNGATSGYARANTADPREKYWFVPGNYGYVGFKNGLLSSNYPSGYDISNYACINVSSNGYFYYVSNDNTDSRMYYPVENYAEVLFLEAEAALRGYISGDPQSLYVAGITASINDVATVSGGSESTSSIQTYINGLPAWASASTNEAKLKLIAVQKWIAVFPNSCEGWAEIRRTGYPDDLAYPDISSNAVVTSGDWIQRISYPNNEYQYNNSNMPTNYQSSSSFYSKREQYGVWWSLCGQDKTLANGYVPHNTF